MIDIWLIIFFIIAILSSFLIKFYGKNSIGRTFGFAVGAFAISMVSIDVCLINSKGLSIAIWFIAVDIQIAMAYFVSVLIYEKYLDKLTLQRRIFYFVVIPFIVINFLIIVLSSSYRVHPIFNEPVLTLDDNLKSLLTQLKIIFQSILQLAAFLNSILLFLRYDKKDNKRKFFFILSLAFLFTAIRGIWDTSYYLSVCSIVSEFFEIFNQAFYFVATILFIIAAVKLNAFGGQGKNFLKKFLIYLFQNFIIILTFLILLSLHLPAVGNQYYELYVFVPLFAFLLVQHWIDNSGKK